MDEAPIFFGDGGGGDALDQGQVGLESLNTLFHLASDLSGFLVVLAKLLVELEADHNPVRDGFLHHFVFLSDQSLVGPVVDRLESGGGSFQQVVEWLEVALELVELAVLADLLVESSLTLVELLNLLFSLLDVLGESES